MRRGADWGDGGTWTDTKTEDTVTHRGQRQQGQAVEYRRKVREGGGLQVPSSS